MNVNHICLEKYQGIIEGEKMIKIFFRNTTSTTLATVIQNLSSKTPTTREHQNVL